MAYKFVTAIQPGAWIDQRTALSRPGALRRRPWPRQQTEFSQGQRQHGKEQRDGEIKNTECQQRRQQFHTARVNEFLDPLNPNVSSFAEQGRAFFFQQTGDPAASQQMTWQALADLRDQQAASLAYFDDFWLFAVLALALVFLVPLMKRSVAEPGEHIGAE